MLSAILTPKHSYPAFSACHLRLTKTGTPEVCTSRSFRTFEIFPQCSRAYAGYRPNCLTTFWTQLALGFKGWTILPLRPSPASGCLEPTSRCQTSSSMRSLEGHQPVIPKVTFIRWATALPHKTVGSLKPAFAPARRVGLAVKPLIYFCARRLISV